MCEGPQPGRIAQEGHNVRQNRPCTREKEIVEVCETFSGRMRCFLAQNTVPYFVSTLDQKPSHTVTMGKAANRPY
jgi:hypothetical protein